MYMLDTNICIYVINKRPFGVLDRFNEAAGHGLSISVVTYAELQYGVERSRSRKRNQRIVDDFISRLDLIGWDPPAAREYAKQRARLEKLGRPIGNMDLLIASHALSRKLILVANNQREFKRIRGLKCENWL